MTNGALTSGIVVANLALCGLSTLAQATAADGAANPLLTILQSGGAAGVLAVFCWHFIKQNKQQAAEFKEERRALKEEMQALKQELKEEQAKCKKCDFVQQANQQFINTHTDHDEK